MILRLVAVGSVVLLAGSMAMAARLQIGKDIVTRGGTLQAILKLSQPLAGNGQLTLTWTDSYDRTVAVEKRRVKVNGTEVAIRLPLARAVALQNFLAAELKVGRAVVRARKAEFIVTPEYARWDDYQIIMYYAYKPDQQDALRDIGITAGKLASGETQRLTGAARWYEHGYRFYCDQISTFFYASYHTPAQKPKHKMLLDAKAAYEKDRSSKAPFCRKPCLHDKAALAKAVARLRTAVRKQERYKPFFYAHCDEAGVADLVTAWDFCFDPRTLAAMREWLLEQYGSLDAINAQWGTDFATINDVVPLSTDEMMARGDDNLSPWADHRFFMNKAFADALRAGTDAVLQEDPNAYVGLVGCQMPAAFGGYDYWLLSKAMTCVEPYNIGNNREVWRSFAPDKPATTTAFAPRGRRPFGEMEKWRLWYQMLHGDLGIIIYDERNRYLTADGKATKLAQSIAPTYRELTGGIRKQMAYMERVNDPIAIHYSQPSITAHWMLEARPEGKKWTRRSSGTERKTSDFLRLRESYTKLIEDNLLQYDFVAHAQLESGQFDKMGCKVMMLPQSIAMSQTECDALRRFVRRGGTLIADCRTALMDERCRMLERGQLDDLFGIKRSDLKFAPGPAGLKPSSKQAGLVLPDLPHLSAAEPGIVEAGGVAMYKDSRGASAVIRNHYGKGQTIYLNAIITDYHRWRLKPPEGDALRDLAEWIFKDAGAARQVPISAVRGYAYGLEVHRYRSGKMQLLGIHRNYQLRVSELGPPSYRSQEALQQPTEVKLDLGRRSAVYDQRNGKYLGKKRHLTVTVPTYEPVLLTVLPEPVEELAISAPRTARPGQLVQANLKLKGKALGQTHALRVKVLGPDGKEVKVLTQTLVAPAGNATWKFPLALSDPAGRYILQVRDVATGTCSEHELTVGTMDPGV